MKLATALLLTIPSTISAFGVFQKPNIFPNFGIAEPDAAAEKNDLYTEIDELLDSALLMYPIAELRDLAKKGELSKEFLELPMSASKLESLIEANMDVVAKKLDSPESELRMDALRAIVARQKNQRRSKSKAVCVEFEDEQSNKELVYSVRKDPARKRVIVAFRGSVTTKDFVTDATLWMKDMPNRMKQFDPQNQPDVVRVHAGFWYYLFGKSSLTETEYNELAKLKPELIELIEGEEISKFDEILQFHVLPLLKKNPGYTLSVTGHSLGASLATMFAFRAATSENEAIIKPVTCVSVASPYVGDENYRQAFMLAEKMGRIRHLRLSNHKDVVTIGPFISLRPRFWKGNPSSGRLFKHVGLNIKLYEKQDPSYEITYPNDGLVGELSRAWGQSFLTNQARPSDYMNNHSPLEYNDRLEKAEDALRDDTLESMYQKFMNKD